MNRRLLVEYIRALIGFVGKTEYFRNQIFLYDKIEHLLSILEQPISDDICYQEGSILIRGGRP